jgi:hypothetical protein
MVLENFTPNGTKLSPENFTLCFQNRLIKLKVKGIQDKTLEPLTFSFGFAYSVKPRDKGKEAN